MGPQAGAHMTHDRADLERVKQAAIDRADDLFRQAWGEPLKAAKREWRSREGGKNSGMVMQMHGGKRGLWTDHKSGTGGDILDFIAVQFLGLQRARDSFPRVIDEAARLCGVNRDGPAPDLSKLEAQRSAREAAGRAQEEQDAQTRAELVRALVALSGPLEGTPAETYLAGRGIDALPPGMGFLPPVPGKGVLHPGKAALVAWATDEAGTVRGGQRILVNLDGTPAQETPRKPAFGAIGGFPCRFPAQAPGGPLVVAEGPETAAAIWRATGFEVWAVFGAGQFAAAPLPIGRKVILCPDRDAPASQAADAFERACLEHAARGHDLWIAEAPEDEGSKRDLNDTLQRAGKGEVCRVVKGAVKFTPRDGKGRFTGGGAIPSETPVETPVFLDPDAARKGIRQAVKGWLGKAAAWQENPDKSPPPVLAIAATPGAGKSTITREVLASFDLSNLGGDVIYTAPTLGLADEAAQHSAQVGGGNHVTRGRSARIPGTDATMCARSGLAETTAKAGLRVKPTLCEREDKETGTTRRCPNYESCAYLRQWATLPPEPATRFEAAQYLTLPGDGSDRETGVRIIDESVWRLFVRTADIPLDAWTRPRRAQDGRTPAKTFEATGRASDATKAAGDVLSALQAGNSPVLDRYTANDFEAFGEAERGPEVVSATPDASDAEILDAVSHQANFDEGSGKRAALWSVLADCARRGLGATERVRLVRDVPAPGSGEKRDVIRVTWFVEPPRDRPALILDADATPEILERLFPGAELVRFDLKPNAEAVQLTDRTFSHGALKRPEVRKEVAELVRAESYRDRLTGGRGVLAIATRKAVRAMFEDAGHDFDNMDPSQVSEFMMQTELHGARWLWFGPASLGRNDWQDFGTAVVLGREELPLDALEDMTRAMFGDTGKPLRMVTPDDHGRCIMPELPLPVTMENGTGWAILGKAHPDPRARAIQMQTRELATRQAFERLRLVNATDRKRVVLASSVPVPGLPVSRLETWDELKPARLFAAMSEAAQRGGVLRLSAAGLSADAPETFPTPKAAERWLSKEGQMEIKYPPAANKGSITGEGVFNPVPVSLRLEGQRGRATRALIVIPGNPHQIAEAQLGPLVAFEVDHAQEAREDAAPSPKPDTGQDTVTAADFAWSRAARIAGRAEQERRRKAVPDYGGRGYGTGTYGRQPAPSPQPAPGKRLAIVPKAARLAIRLGDPVSRYVVEPSGPRLVWMAEHARRVADAFDRYRTMTQADPEAWE